MQTKYGRDHSDVPGAIRRGDVQRMEKVASNVMLPDVLAGTKGKRRLMVVDIYFDPETTRHYEIEVNGPYYRFSNPEDNADPIVVRWSDWMQLFTVTARASAH